MAWLAGSSSSSSSRLVAMQPLTAARNVRAQPANSQQTAAAAAELFHPVVLSACQACQPFSQLCWCFCCLPELGEVHDLGHCGPGALPSADQHLLQGSKGHHLW
jgi:hypothetical protein